MSHIYRFVLCLKRFNYIKESTIIIIIINIWHAVANAPRPISSLRRRYPAHMPRFPDWTTVKGKIWSFIDFWQFLNFDVKGRGRGGFRISVKLTLVVGKIDMWVTPKRISTERNWQEETTSNLFHIPDEDTLIHNLVIWKFTDTFLSIERLINSKHELKN